MCPSRPPAFLVALALTGPALGCGADSMPAKTAPAAAQAGSAGPAAADGAPQAVGTPFPPHDAVANAVPGGGPPAMGGTRALVIQGTVVACVVKTEPDGVADGESCGGQITAVGVAPLRAGPVTVKTWPSIATVGDEDDGPCSELQYAQAGQASLTQTGRTLTQLDPAAKNYVSLIGDVLAYASPPITDLYRVDLEGDGKDEVLFNVDSHPGAWPMEATEDIVSASGVRRLVPSGDVTTSLFHRHLVKRGSAEFSSLLMLRGQVFGLTDLDGDGALEIVVKAGYYEGTTWLLFRLPVGGADPVLLGQTGCGA